MNSQKFEDKVRWTQDVLSRLRDRMNECVDGITPGTTVIEFKGDLSRYALAVDLIQKDLKDMLKQVDDHRAMSHEPEKVAAIPGLDVGSEAGVVE